MGETESYDMMHATGKDRVRQKPKMPWIAILFVVACAGLMASFFYFLGNHQTPQETPHFVLLDDWKNARDTCSTFDQKFLDMLHEDLNNPDINLIQWQISSETDMDWNKTQCCIRIRPIHAEPDVNRDWYQEIVFKYQYDHCSITTPKSE